MSYEDYKSGRTQQAGYESVAFRRFGAIASPINGVKRFPLRLVYDQDDVATYGLQTLRQNWFQDLVGGTTDVKKEELPDWASFGLDLRTFMINPSVYLAWYVFYIYYMKYNKLRRKIGCNLVFWKQKQRLFGGRTTTLIKSLTTSLMLSPCLIAQA